MEVINAIFREWRGEILLVIGAGCCEWIECVIVPVSHFSINAKVALGVYIRES